MKDKSPEIIDLNFLSKKSQRTRELLYMEKGLEKLKNQFYIKSLAKD